MSPLQTFRISSSIPLPPSHLPTYLSQSRILPPSPPYIAPPTSSSSFLSFHPFLRSLNNRSSNNRSKTRSSLKSLGSKRWSHILSFRFIIPNGGFNCIFRQHRAMYWTSVSPQEVVREHTKGRTTKDIRG